MSGFQHDIAGGAGNLIVKSVQSPNYSAGSAGWQIRKDGSAEFNNLTIRGTFNGTDFILNSNGFFTYTAAPALGNLSASIVPGTTTITDPEGNTAQPGITVYARPGDGNTYVQASGTIPGLTIPGFWVQNQTHPVTQPPYMSGDSVTTAGTELTLSSGRSTSPAADSQIHLQDSVLSAVTNGLMSLITGKILFGLSGSMVWDDNAAELDLPAGGGPFILSEGWHDISNGVGGVVARVKKLPWNAVWIDVEATEGTTGTFTLAALPDSSYAPVRDRHFPVGATAGTQARLFIPAAGGAVQLIIAGGVAWSGGASVTYPTN